MSASLSPANRAHRLFVPAYRSTHCGRPGGLRLQLSMRLCFDVPSSSRETRPTSKRDPSATLSFAIKMRSVRGRPARPITGTSSPVTFHLVLLGVAGCFFVHAILTMMASFASAEPPAVVGLGGFGALGGAVTGLRFRKRYDGWVVVDVHPAASHGSFAFGWE